MTTTARVLAFVLVLGAAAGARAADHYVRPDGAADAGAWEASTDAGRPCALSVANASAAAGDTVILRGGTYTTHIAPANSGTADDPLAYVAYAGEVPVLGDTAPWIADRQIGIALQNRSYVRIDGITVDADQFTQPGPNSSFVINGGSHHIELANCVFTGRGAGTQVYDATHVWIHGCTFRDIAVVAESCDDPAIGLQIGVPAVAGVAGYNTIEDNHFQDGGHHNLETFTFYNVIRNNFFHNEGNVAAPAACSYGPDSNGLYGNRNIQLYDGTGAAGTYNLLEGNRFGPSGPPPDDDGGDGMTITAPRNIVRYNEVYGAHNNGVYFKVGAASISDDNRFYNNTIYGSARFHNDGPQWQGHNFRQPGGYAWYDLTSIVGVDGVVTVTLPSVHRLRPGGTVTIEDTASYNGNHTITGVGETTLTFDLAGTHPAESSGTARGGFPTTGNVVKNNIVYGALAGGSDWGLGELQPDYNTYADNLCTAAAAPCSVVGDPAFADGTLPPIVSPPSRAAPMLQLQPASPAIDRGTHLTVAAAAGSAATSLTVEDALYLQDGSWGSDLARPALHADWIALGTPDNVVEIASIDYASGVIELRTAATWAAGAPVWLYSKSDGLRVLYGAGPDLGAHEWDPGAPAADADADADADAEADIGGDAADEDAGGDQGAPGSDAGGGCGCAVAARTRGTGAALLVLAVAGLRRRRLPVTTRRPAAPDDRR